MDSWLINKKFPTQLIMLDYHGEQLFSAYKFQGKPTEAVEYTEQRLRASL